MHPEKHRTLKPDKRQPVLFLLPDLAVGGDAARVLAMALGEEGFLVTIALHGRGVDAHAEDVEAAGVEVRSIPIRHALDLSGAWRLRSVVEECKPVLIHAWGATAARLSRMFVSRDSSFGNTPRLVVTAASRPGGGFLGWLGTRQIRRADRVTPTTRADGERYRRLGVPVEELTLIAPAAPESLPDGKPGELFQELGIPRAARLIVASGPSEGGFGPRDAIIAFDMLRYDLKDLRLAIFGAGAEAAALEQFGRSLAFDDFRVHFAGATPSRVQATIAAVVVLATSPIEGVATALDAMAAGKPVVGWNTADLAEIVEDKVTGLLAPPGDRAALAASARAILDNPPYARRLGEAGRARAAERFGLRRMVEQFARLYREIIPTGAGLL
jgi:glycosyltransferase involved in cell wall biosynthesis